MGQGPNEPKTEKHIGTGPDSDKNDETVSSHGQSSANRIHAKDTEESEFVAGSSFGRFQIVRLLGRGGMGYVYLAFDSKLERQIALKVMRPDVARHQRERDRFIREARAAAKISSDHVVVVFDADEVDGVPYIAQQFLAGCTLDEYLKSKPQLTIPLISRFAREICEGLRVAHNSGMVHRDIKLSNLWVESPNQRIKILDFGLAYVEQSDEALTLQGTILGTPAFMSPEQAMGKVVDPKSDLFSVGIVLYRLCVGQLPFVGNNPIATMHSLLHDEPESVNVLNPTVPIGLSRVVDKLLEKDRQLRYSSASDALAALQALESSESGPTLALPRPISKQKGRLISPQILSGMAAVLLVLIGAFLFLGQVNRDDLPEFRKARTLIADLERRENIPPKRVAITYEIATESSIEKLDPPFVIGVFANLSGQINPSKRLFQELKFVEIDSDNFDAVLNAVEPKLILSVPDRLDDKGSRIIELTFRSIDDFDPMAVARQVPDIAKLIELRISASSQLNPSSSRINALDTRISVQLREIFQHLDFRRLESTWRGLALLINSVPIGKQLKIRVIDVRKKDLMDDILLANSSLDSNAFQKVFYEQLGSPGGEPFGLLIGDFEIGSDIDEIYLLSSLGKVAAFAGAPIVLSASPSMFRVSSFKELASASLDSIDLGSDWQRFRESPEAKYVGLTLPRFIARLPYSPNTKTPHEFDFYETLSEFSAPVEDITWMSGVWLFAANVAKTYGKFGWPARISGEQGGGKFDWLPEYPVSSKSKLSPHKKSMDGMLEQSKQLSLIRSGFMPFDPGKESEPTMLLRAQSCSPDSRLNELLCAASFLRVLRIIARDRVGYSEVDEMNTYFKKWLNYYCLPDLVDATEDDRIRRPLLEGSVDFQKVPNEVGSAILHLKIRPHYQFNPPPSDSIEFAIPIPLKAP